MKCTHTIELLPLYAGGDLPEAKTEAVREHLRGCADCRALAEEFAAEFAAGSAWLRDQLVPDFGEDDFEQLRAAVWQRIDREEARVPFWERFFPRMNGRMVLAMASAALLIAFGLAVYLRAARSGQVPKHEIAEATPEPSPVKRPAIGLPPAIGQKRELKRGLKREFKRETARQSNRRNAPLRRQLIPAAPATQPEIARGVEGEVKSAPEMTRIEIQTADPKIRIIWFAPKEESPKSDSMLATSD